MSIIIDPDVLPPAPPVEAVSPDGILTVRRDDANAGVYLIANYSSSPPQKVKFVRVGVDGVEVPVRGGDLAWAPGGVAVAYDHEAPLGLASSWYAYPVSWAGVIGARSAGVSVTVPEPEPTRDVWIKSITEPGLSLRVRVMTWPTLEFAERQERFDVLGASAPVMRVDPWSLPTSSAQIETTTLAERLALRALLTAGTTVLVQTRQAYGREDTYWVPGKLAESMTGDASDPHRTWDVPMTAVARPPTIDAPLRIPGRSYDDSTELWPTYADRTATGQTYQDVTTGG